MKKLLTTLLVLSLVTVAGLGCDSKKEGGEEPAQKEAPEGENAQVEEAEKAAPAQEEEKEAEEEQVGQWAESSTYNLKFRVPEGWDMLNDDQGVSATDPQGTTTVLLAGSKSQELAKSMLTDLRAELEFKDITIEKSGPTTINGMPAFRGTGTGVLEKEEGDQEIQFLGYTVKREGDQIATLFIFSEAEMYEAKKDIIQGIANTLVETSE